MRCRHTLGIGLLVSFLAAPCPADKRILKNVYSDQEGVSQSIGILSKEVTQVAFSPKGDLLATGGFDKTIRFWDTQTWKVVNQIQTKTLITEIAWGLDGKVLAVVSSASQVQIWDVRSGQLLMQLQPADRDTIYALASDGKAGMVTTNSKGIVRTWNLETGKLQENFTADPLLDSVRVEPDCDIIAVGGRRSTAWVWNRGTKTVKWKIPTHTEINALCFYSKCSICVTGGGDNGKLETILLKTWKLGAGGIVQEVENLARFYVSAPVHALAVSADKRILASGGGDYVHDYGELFLWDIVNNKSVVKLRSGDGLITSIDFSPKSNVLISGSESGVIRLWNIPDFKTE